MTIPEERYENFLLLNNNFDNFLAHFQKLNLDKNNNIPIK